MASINKRYILLALLIILNIILRFPVTPHERGIDSFFVHSLANSILTTGHAEWIIHPLSVFGLYPMSYPSGIPFLLSELSSVTGLNMESTILFVSLFFAVIGVFSMYLLAKEITDDDLFIFLAIFVFSTTPIFIDYTSWTITTRGALIAFVPLFIWAILKCHNSQHRWMYVFLSMLVFTTLVTIHRAALLLIVFVIAHFISLWIWSLSKRIRLNDKQKAFFIKSTPFIFILCFIILLSLPFSNIPIYSELFHINRKVYSTFLFQDVRSPFLVLVNMMIYYVVKSGILIILVPVGLITALRKLDSFNVRFISLSFLLFTGIIGLRAYTLISLLTILAILTALGFSRLISLFRGRKMLMSYIIIGCLLLSIIFSCFMMNHWNAPDQASVRSPYMKSATYYTGLYLKEYAEDASIEGVTADRIHATFNIISPVIDSYNIKTSFSLSYFTRTHLSPYKISTQTLTYRIDKQDIKYNIEHHTTNFEFFRSARREKDKIYDNNLESIWYINS